jgi:hypothetical protein
MIYIDLIKGISAFLIAILYFKYFDKPLFNKKKKENLKREGLENLIEDINLLDNVRDLKGKIGGYGLIIIALMFFFKFVKTNFL